MADWNQIVADYEARIDLLEKEIENYLTSASKTVLITSGIAFFVGLLIGIVV